MNITIVECDLSVAAKKYKEYAQSVEPTAADEQCKRIYRAISRGKRVIELTQALRLGGVDHRYRPRLAIARANQTGSVMFQWDWSTNMPLFGRNSRINGKEPGVRTHAVRLPAWTFPRQDGENSWHRGHFGKDPQGRYVTSISAAIPVIPPSIRPIGAKVGLYHILWEVDQWVDGRAQAPQSRDPLLLRHIGGWFFVIVAEWDLTAVERSVFSLSMTR